MKSRLHRPRLHQSFPVVWRTSSVSCVSSFVHPAAARSAEQAGHLPFSCQCISKRRASLPGPAIPSTTHGSGRELTSMHPSCTFHSAYAAWRCRFACAVSFCSVDWCVRAQAPHQCHPDSSGAGVRHIPRARRPPSKTAHRFAGGRRLAGGPAPGPARRFGGYWIASTVRSASQAVPFRRRLQFAWPAGAASLNAYQTRPSRSAKRRLKR